MSLNTPPRRLFLAALIANSVLTLTACGPQADNTPAVSVLGIVNRYSIVGRPTPTLQIEEISRSDKKTASYNYSAVNLPAGISINTNTGAITGTPTAAGTYPITVTVSNANGKSSRQFTWTVTADSVAVQRIISTSEIRLEASDTTLSGSTRWCFVATNGTAPAIPAAPDRTDACWQATRTRTFPNASPVPVYTMWSVDASDNVSAPLSVPCSSNVRSKAAEGADPRTVVCVSTSLGELAIELDTVKAPLTSAHFNAHVNVGFYDGMVFHRIHTTPTPDRPFAVAQAGAYTYSNNLFTEKLSPYTALTAIEIPPLLTNVAGSVAITRNSGPSSNPLQFLGAFSINFADNPCLNPNDNSCAGTAQDPPLPVFGRIIYGADTTVTALKGAAIVATPWGEPSQPQSPPVIYGAYRIR